MSTQRFPGESPEYRKARDELLQAELALKRQVEKVAEQRRDLPEGGEVAEDYEFAASDGTTIRLSELFADGQDTLVLYNFMYGPEMENACPMCTSFLDGLNGNAPHIIRRVSLAVVAKNPIGKIQDYADGRGWGELRMLSSAGNTFNRDYSGEDASGNQNTMMHVFAKRGGRVRHFWSSELNAAQTDPGQDARHIDMMWPLWNVLDITPDGRGKDWYPERSYS